MKKLLLLFIFAGVIISCGNVLERPKNLVSEDKMSEAVAELAISDQLGIVNPSYSVTDQTIYVFNQLKIKPADFADSYKYYIATGKMEKILDNAQKIILKKDPKAKEYINKKSADEPSFR